MTTNTQENEMTSVNAKHEALLDELLKDYTSPQDILGEHGLLKQLTKRVVERVLEAELTAHLGYAPHRRQWAEEENARNGKGQKTVQTKAVYVAVGINMDGEKELLGLWLSESEAAKFWLSVFTELHNRGVEDCCIACVDGLKGLPEAIEAVFPKTQVQLCIVHKVRNSLKYVPWKERRAVAADLRAIYPPPSRLRSRL